ncbi:MAG TPA: DoxX family protein [Thermoanaerobaculia bacterium]|nr:DoxX family protein [Thermoanaerobaculia bacterium]
MRYVVPVGRAMVAAIFLKAVPEHFQEETIAFVSEQGIPLAGVFVPLAGFLALAGGLSVLLGWRAKLGAWLLVAFLVPVTLLMHPFWAVTDAALAAMQEAMFYKNVAILGGALLITYFGAGPLSMDASKAEPALHEIRQAA